MSIPDAKRGRAGWRHLTRPAEADRFAPEPRARQTRITTALLEHIQAIEEGQQGVGPDASVQDRARAPSPTGEIFAGSASLAPVDPLPWPFVAAAVQAPSVFTPIDLTPREWRDGSFEVGAERSTPPRVVVAIEF